MHPTIETTDTSGQQDLPALAGARFDTIRKSADRLRALVIAPARERGTPAMILARALGQLGHDVTLPPVRTIAALLGGGVAGSFLAWRRHRAQPDALVFLDGAPDPAWLRSVGNVPRLVLLPVIPATESGIARNPAVAGVAVSRPAAWTLTRQTAAMSAGATVATDPALFFLGCDTVRCYPDRHDPAHAAEVSFVADASDATPQRLDLIRSIGQNFHMRVYGRDWERTAAVTPTAEIVRPETFRAICASSCIVLGIENRHDIPLCFSERVWLTLGCGGFLLTRHVPAFERLFTNHEHLVWYHSHDECLDLIRYYLEHEKDRERIAAAGCRYVHTYHTTRHAAARIAAEIAALRGPAGGAATP